MNAGNWMAQLALGLFLTCISSLPANAEADNNPTELANRIMTSIINKDSSIIIEHTNKGICFVDDCFKKREIINLLNNESSWLYTWLFTRDESLRNYLTGTGNITIHINNYKMFYEICYLSETSTRVPPPTITIRKDKDRWFITNMDIF